jgi:phosphoglycolate phosphatase
MQLTIPKTVIFDWDNTLVSSWNKLHAAISKTMVHFDMEPWTMNQVKARMHRSSREFFPAVFGDNWEKARELYYKKYNDSKDVKVTPLDHAANTLEMLKTLGLKMAIISNKTGPYLRLEIEALGWSKYFDSILGAYDLDEDKPSPKPVYHTLEKLGYEAGLHNWFVGDTIIDIECAFNSGCYPVLFGEQIEEAPHPDDLDIKHSHAQDHLDLMELFKMANL